MSLLAFPTAEGYGRWSLGGRGTGSPTPVVEKVTNLNNSGTGSLRAALDKNYPRFIHFDVEGMITVTSPLRVSYPYCTVSFQTAPGKGIQLRGDRFSIETHNVVVRHMRSRPGIINSGANWFTAPTNNPTAMTLYQGSADTIYNVIVDHCSCAWSLDENYSCYVNKMYGVSMQWGLTYEPVRRQLYPYGSYNSLLAGSGTNAAQVVGTLSYHHNLTINNGARHPLLSPQAHRAGGVVDYLPVWKVDLRNNLFYNWNSNGFAQLRGTVGHQTAYDNLLAYPGNATNTVSAVDLNMIANYWKHGPNSAIANKGIIWFYNMGLVKTYLEQNKGPISNDPKDGGLIGVNLTPQNHTAQTAGSSVYYESGWDYSRHIAAQEHVVTDPVTTHSVSEIEELLVAKCGATHPVRDAVDTRVINEFLAGTGITQYQNHFDYETYGSTSPPTDTDGDGIPDSWEASHGGSLNAFDVAPNGYFHYENYINELAGDIITGYGSGVSAWFLTKSRQGKKASGAIY